MSKIREGIREIKEDWANGDRSAVDCYQDANSIKAQLEEQLKEVKGVMDEMREQAAREVKEYEYNYGGMTWEFRNGRRVWDFKGVPEWAELEQQRKKVEAKLRGAFEARERGQTIVDEVTGEIVPLPGVKFTKDVLILKPNMD